MGDEGISTSDNTVTWLVLVYTTIQIIYLIEKRDVNKMYVWHCSSSESRRCVVCGKKTGTYKVYEQSGMEFRAPLCDSMERPSCYSRVNVESMSRLFLIEVKKEIKRQGEYQ